MKNVKKIFEDSESAKNIFHMFSYENYEVTHRAKNTDLCQYWEDWTKAIDDLLLDHYEKERVAGQPKTVLEVFQDLGTMMTELEEYSRNDVYDVVTLRESAYMYIGLTEVILVRERFNSESHPEKCVGSLYQDFIERETLKKSIPLEKLIQKVKLLGATFIIEELTGSLK